MRHRSLFCHTGIVVLLIVSLAACSQQGTSNKNGGGRGGRGQRAGGGGQPVDVRTSGVQRISIQRSVELSGTLVSPDQARVSSEVAGIVRDVLVEIGQEVKIGQELVRLDTTELNLALQRAESALRQTEAQLGIAEGTALPQDEQISAVRTAAAYQSAVENVQSLKASLQDRRAAYDLAKKKLSDAIIRAPIAGAIAERSAQRGEYIRENTPVATIVRMNPLKLRTGVQEKYANMIHQNQMVDFQVEPYPNEMFHGKIAYISPAVDQGTRTFTAEILVDNPQYKLKPGFFTKGEILVHRDENVLAVPEETVSNLAGVSSVYVINNGVVKQTTIRTGEHEGKFIEVVEGLKGDEILASSNLNELVSGSRVGGGDEEGATAVGDNGAGGDRRGSKGGGRGGKGGRRSGGEGKGG